MLLQRKIRARGPHGATRHYQRAAAMLALFTFALAVAGCANDAASQSATNGSAPPASPGVAAGTQQVQPASPRSDAPPPIQRMSAH